MNNATNKIEVRFAEPAEFVIEPMETVVSPTADSRRTLS